MWINDTKFIAEVLIQLAWLVVNCALIHWRFRKKLCTVEQGALHIMIFIVGGFIVGSFVYCV